MEPSYDNNLRTLEWAYRENAIPEDGSHFLKILIQGKGTRILRNILAMDNDDLPEEKKMTQRRFEIDALLQYYSLLQVAIIAGHISEKLTTELVEEVKLLLKNKEIANYYNETCPNVLLQLFSTLVSNNQSLNVESTEEREHLFNEFLVITKSMETDEDISIFISLIAGDPIEKRSGVRYKSENLLILLKNLRELRAMLKNTSSENELVRASWGFFQFANYLMGFSKLLDKARTIPAFQSAIWEYHKWAFKKLNGKLQGFFEEVITGFDDSYANLDYSDFELTQEETSEELEFVGDRNRYLEIISTARKNWFALNEKRPHVDLLNYYPVIFSQADSPQYREVKIEATDESNFDLDGFRSGEESAFKKFFDLHFKSCVYYAYQIIKDQQQSENIVLDIFLYIWNRPDLRVDIKRTTSYLYVSIRNRCFNYLRDAKREIQASQAYEFYVAKSEEMDIEMLRLQAVNNIYDQINRLPEIQQRVVKMLFQDGMSVSEVAKALNIMPATVRVHKHKALNWLRRMIIRRKLGK